METRAVLKQVTPLAGAPALATVQLTELGNLETFHDGYAVSHAIDPALLTPGADVVVDIPDLNHPGDGQIVAVARVSSGAGTVPVEQFGNVLVATDGSGSGSAAVIFPNTFGAFSSPPAVSVSAASSQLGSGSLSVSAVTTAGFTVNVSGAASVSSSIAVAWDARG